MCHVLCISSLIVAINAVGLTSEMEVQVASCKSHIHGAVTVGNTWSRMHMNFIATSVQVKIDERSRSVGLCSLTVFLRLF